LVKKKIDDEEDDVEPEEEQEDVEDVPENGDDDADEQPEDDDNVEPPHVEDTPPKPEKVGNIDSLVFLKEYARDINRAYTNVATKLGIGKS